MGGAREGQDPKEVPDIRGGRRPGLRKGKESLNLAYPPNHRERRSLDAKLLLHPPTPPTKLYKS